jgi:threonine/homoserine/homoserine lactone efflux protein
MMKMSLPAASVLLLLALAPLTASAQLDPIEGPECLGLPCSGTSTGRPAGGITERIIVAVNAAVILILALAFLFLVYAGYKYVTSAGNEDAAAQAKRQILYACIGIIIAMGATVSTSWAPGQGSGPLLYDTIRSIAEGNPNATLGLQNIAGNFIQLASYLIGIVAAIYLTYAGYKYINSRGDYEGAEAARRQIVYAIIGIVVAGGARFISDSFITWGQGQLLPAAGPSASQTAGIRLALVFRGPVNVVLALASIAAAAYIIMAGVMYFTAAGDESQAEEAKRQVIYGLVGMGVILLSVAFVNFIIEAIV